jgi:hypothetical protein
MNLKAGALAGQPRKLPTKVTPQRRKTALKQTTHRNKWIAIHPDSPKCNEKTFVLLWNIWLMTRRLKQILCGILMLPLVAMPLEANAQTAPEANAVAADPAVAEILNEPPMGAGANAFAYRGSGGYIAGYQRNVSSAFVMRGGYYGTAPKTIGVELDGYLLQFDAPGDANLTVGSYTGATRYPFNTTEPGIDFSGNGRGCNTISGEYFIDDFAYDAQGTTRLAARWVHRCEGGTLPEYGWVTYNTTVRYGWVGSDLLTTDV